MNRDLAFEVIQIRTFHLYFICNLQSDCQTSPAMMNIGVQNSIINKTEIHQCSSPSEAVRRTDVIVTTGHDIPSLALLKKVD